MKKILTLILILCIVLISSAFAKPENAYVWRTESDSYEICVGSINHVGFNDSNDACMYKYGSNVLEKSTTDKVYSPVTENNRPLDVCAHYNNMAGSYECGKVAADLYCKKNGKVESSSFTTSCDAPNRQTYKYFMDNDGNLIGGGNCNSCDCYFSSITCTETQQSGSVAGSVCEPEYKEIEGCGLIKENAQKCSCTFSDIWKKPDVTVGDNYIWQKKDENFVFCSNGALSVVPNGDDACTTKYNRTSISSICNTIYNTEQEIGCGKISGESRLCKCAFPSGVDKPIVADFSVSDITPTVPAQETPAPSSSGGSSSSNGGSSNRNIAASDLSKRTDIEIDIANGVGIYYDLGNKGTFEFKGEKHDVYLKQIKGNSVVIVFESNPIEVELSLGERKNIDINGDGKEDLDVTLIKIYEDKAEVKIKEIVEKKEEIKLEEEKEGIEEITGSAVSEFRARDYAIGATLILLAGIFVFLIIRIVKKVAQ